MRRAIMIDREMILEVERLIREQGYSQRRIAELVGISRTSVCSIAKGRLQQKLADHGDEPRVGRHPRAFGGPLRRCHTCGGRVHMPCLLCQVRAIKAQELTTKSPRRSSGGMPTSKP